MPRPRLETLLSRELSSLGCLPTPAFFFVDASTKRCRCGYGRFQGVHCCRRTRRWGCGLVAIEQTIISSPSIFDSLIAENNCVSCVCLWIFFSYGLCYCFSIGISRDSMHKRRATSGKKKAWRKRK